jgi:predicted DNA-binding protein YlxM (UPF0122 family)
VGRTSTTADRQLPDGDVIERLRKEGHTFAEIGERYAVSRQAVHKAHKKWLTEKDLIVVSLD